MQAINWANRRNAAIATFSQNLPPPEAHRGEILLSGIFFAYLKPGEEFGATVAFCTGNGRYRVLEVPPNYRNVRDAVLVIRHEFENGIPSFAFKKDGRDTQIAVPDAAKIVCVTDFPQEGGWYLPHAFGWGIPSGKEVSQQEQGAMRLWRAKEHMGLQAVWFDWQGNQSLHAHLNIGISDGHAALFDMRGAKPIPMLERISTKLSEFFLGD